VLDARRARAYLRPSRALAPGMRLALPDVDGTIVVGPRAEDLWALGWEGEGTWEALLARAGHVPLPPYIRRPDDAADRETYQTVYARVPGAVAAPTAGLHFDAALLAAVRGAGVEVVPITLHVGAGTFAPVRVEDLAAHRMHAERYAIGAETAARIGAARQSGGRIVAVGTTVVRALESAWDDATGAPRAGAGETRLFITPGYRFRALDVLLTNFHLPQSTLLMLVCAFGGRERVLRAYAHAVRNGYRFYSYGDATWVEPEPRP
jgi:S-adenosylmethionine:tRNA ribosyltransferase-isomerase